MPDASGSHVLRRRFLLALGIVEHDVNDVLADRWCQGATDHLLNVVHRAATELRRAFDESEQPDCHKDLR